MTVQTWLGKCVVWQWDQAMIEHIKVREQNDVVYANEDYISMDASTKEMFHAMMAQSIESVLDRTGWAAVARGGWA